MKTQVSMKVRLIIAAASTVIAGFIVYLINYSGWQWFIIGFILGGTAFQVIDYYRIERHNKKINS